MYIVHDLWREKVEDFLQTFRRRAATRCVIALDYWSADDNAPIPASSRKLNDSVRRMTPHCAPTSEPPRLISLPVSGLLFEQQQNSTPTMTSEIP